MEWLTTIGRSVMSRSRLFLLLTAGLLIGLVSSTLMATTTFAAEAKWDDGKIVYEEKTFERLSDEQKLKSFNLENQLVYASSAAASLQEITLIHFKETTDVASATTAYVSTYTLTPSSTYALSYTKSITISPPETGATNSCSVEGGLGWFICPTTRFLAGGVDWMFNNLLKGFLEIPRLEVDNTKSGLYIAWDIVRNFANAAFIIMFLIIIYSQVTSAGVSNYGIKKMLPRLIIAAITVNISFLVCAALLDISNVFGGALQEMFLNIRNTVATVGTSQQTSPLGWGEVLGAILAGGAGTVAGITFATELLWFIGPALIGAALIVLIVIVVLAARQALIVILITISPLAFVAYLLPGTEKWFDKWKESFLAMLVFFPAFSAVFGGAQLAGTIIMQNASGANAAVMYILGMLVHIAPLAIAPLLMKLSGGVLNRFAGIMNDKRKGLFDRSMNWAKENAAIQRNRKLANPINPVNRLRRNLDHRSRARKDRLAETEKLAENAYHESERYKRLDISKRLAEDRAALIQQQAANRYGQMQVGQQPDGMKRQYKQAELDAARDLSHQMAIANMANEGIKRATSHQLGIELEKNATLRAQAGMVEDLYFKEANVGENLGSERALGTARAAIRKAREDAISNADAIWGSMNKDDFVIANAAATGSAVDNVNMTDGLRISAIRQIFGGKNAAAIYQGLQQIDFSTLNDDMAEEIGEALKSNPNKPAWVGAYVSSLIKTGQVKSGTGQENLNRWFVDSFNGNKLSTAEVLVTQDQVYMQQFANMVKDQALRGQLKNDQVQTTIKQIELAFSDPLYKGRIGERRNPLISIYQELGGTKDLNRL